MALGFLQVPGWFASVPLSGDDDNQQHPNNDPSVSVQQQQQQLCGEQHDQTKKNIQKPGAYNRSNSLIADPPTDIPPPSRERDDSSSSTATATYTKHTITTIPLQRQAQHSSTTASPGRHRRLHSALHLLSMSSSHSHQSPNNKDQNTTVNTKVHRRTHSNDERIAMLAQLAATKEGDGLLEESCFYYEEMLRIQRYSSAIHQDHDSHSLEVAHTLTKLGDLLRRCSATTGPAGRKHRKHVLHEASNSMKEALSLQRSALGPNHLIVAGTLHSIGMLACLCRDYDAASLAFMEEIQVRKDIMKQDREVCSSEESLVDIGVLNVTMALTMLKRREYGAAYDAFQDALEFYKRAGLRAEHRYVQDVCRFLTNKRLFYTCMERFWEADGVV